MLPVNSLQTLVVLDIKTEEFPISQSTHCGRVSAGGSYALLNTSIEAHSYIVSFGEEKKSQKEIHTKCHEVSTTLSQTRHHLQTKMRSQALRLIQSSR